MFKFLKRQLKTKTGRLGATLIVGTVAQAVLGDTEQAGMVTNIAKELLTPETGMLGLAAMFLRDGAAKQASEE